MLNKKSLLKSIFRLIEISAIVCFISMLAAMGVQVVYRYVFKTPLSGIEEYARFMFIWMVYLGAIISMEKNQFYKVYYFTEKIPEKYRTTLYFLVDLFILMITILLFIYGMNAVYTFKAVKSVVLRWPWKYIYLSMPFSLIFIMIVSINNLKESYINLAKTLRVVNRKD